LLRQTEQQKARLPERRDILTSQRSPPEWSKAKDNNARSNSLRSVELPSDATPLAQATATTNPAVGLQLALWQAPIEFYGKVVDNNSNAVAGATVDFFWVEVPDETGNRTSTIESDGEGLFSLRSAHGPSLSVSVSKAGYYPQRGGAKYGVLGDFSPDPLNPVIFYLRKKGTPEQLVAMKRNYRIPRDGIRVSIDLATGSIVPGENGDLAVQCWTEDQGKRSGQKYDWRCIVAIPSGGLALTDEEYPFSAPENGYKSSIEIKMPANRTDWKSDVDLKFYYLLANGHYGRMTFSMIAGGQHFCMINSVLNPSGSRILEPSD
jgi:hypothetical protein